jgi:hypothetical protein
MLPDGMETGKKTGMAVERDDAAPARLDPDGVEVGKQPARQQMDGAALHMRDSADVHVDAMTLQDKRAFSFAAKGSLLVAEESIVPLCAPDYLRPGPWNPRTMQFEPMTLLHSVRNVVQWQSWLDEHPDLYSIDLKWALIPHVVDALARFVQTPR